MFGPVPWPHLPHLAEHEPGRLGGGRAVALLRAASRRPFHATSAPPTTSSGAAYSTSTASGATALAVTRSLRSRPAAQDSARSGTTVTLSRPICAAARSRKAHLRLFASTSATCAAGSAVASTSPGMPAPGPEIGDAAGVPHVGDLERRECVCDVPVDRLRRIAERCGRERVG